MISLKKLLTEDIKFVLKKSPTAVLSKAADLLAGVFRIKLVGKKDDKPIPIQDVIAVLNSPKNTQFGPTSPYGNGEWYFIISDDLKKSSKKLVNDILVYPKTKKVAVGRGETIYENVEDLFKPGSTPNEVGMVGRSIITTVSDFVEAIDPTVERKYQLKSSPNPIDLGNGAKLISQIKEVLFNTVSDSPSSDEKEIVVKSDGNANIDTQDSEISKDSEDKKDVEDKKNVVKEPVTDVVLTYTSIFDDKNNPGVKAELKITKQELIDNRTKIDNKWVAESFQQLIMQKVVPVFKDKLTTVKTWAASSKPIDGDFGNKSKAVIRSLNKGYKLGDTDEILPELIEKLTAPLKTESVFSLKSILQEIKLQEQDLSGFDFEEAEKVKTNQPVKTDQTKKEPVKTDQSKKEPEKKTTQTKKEPVKTDQTKKEPAKITSRYPRDIDKVADALGVDFYEEANGKHYYIKHEINIVRGPLKSDLPATLFLRTDGTIIVTENGMFQSGTKVVVGSGSGWSDGGRKLVTTKGTYTSNLPSGDAIYETLFKAIRDNSGGWKQYIVNVQSKHGVGWRGLSYQPSLKTPVQKAGEKAGEKAKKPATKKPAAKRDILEVAKRFGVTASYDDKLKAWWFDAYIRIVRGPIAADQYALLHVRDDGTIMVKVKGAKILQGVGSGWSDGGKRLQVKLFSKTAGNVIVKEKTYTSKNAAGSALSNTLLAAIKSINDFWSATQSINARGIYKYKYQGL